MKGLLKFLVVSVLGLVLLNSCDMDMTGEYKYYNAVNYQIKDRGSDEANKKIEADIKAFFNAIPDFDKTHTFYGTYYDAVQHGAKLMKEIADKIDTDAFLKIIGDEDLVQYCLMISGKNSNEPIDFYYLFKGEMKPINVL